MILLLIVLLIWKKKKKLAYVEFEPTPAVWPSLGVLEPNHQTYGNVWLLYFGDFYKYRSVPGKRLWALKHKPSFFTILGACPVYWVLIVCNN